MSNDTETKKPRSGQIELLQVLSVLSIPFAVVLPFSEIKSIAVAGGLFGVLAVYGFVRPLLLAKTREVEAKEEIALEHPPTREFAVTEDRLVTFEVLEIPLDVRLAMKKHMLDIKYTTPKMKHALNAFCGEERVKPYVETILLHTRVVEPPPREQAEACV